MQRPIRSTRCLQADMPLLNAPPSSETFSLTPFECRQVLCPYAGGLQNLMKSGRHIRLFRIGRNQALRIPRDCELDGDEAIIRNDGDRLIVEPVRKGGLLSLLANLKPLG